MKLIYPNRMPKTQHFAFSIDLDFVLKIVHNILALDLHVKIEIDLVIKNFLKTKIARDQEERFFMMF